ncbi:ATP-binding protein [Lentzea guizhouensis]|uniref:ATP-binding protein n=1 Tax=Lentzea guizhouensis TaxID=1586287 RepID=UPI0008FF3D50
MAAKPGLVGRDRETTQLAGALTAAAHGDGHLVVASGGLGVGKTALLATARELAAEHGFTVLAAGSFLERELPFGVVSRLFVCAAGAADDVQHLPRIAAAGPVRRAGRAGPGDVARAARPAPGAGADGGRPARRHRRRRRAVGRPAVAAVAEHPAAPHRAPAGLRAGRDRRGRGVRRAADAGGAARGDLRRDPPGRTVVRRLARVGRTRAGRARR